MRFLLDTHALLWALTAPDRLGRAAAEVLANREELVCVSAVSAWEIATKQRLGKLPHAEAIVAGYGRHLDRLGVERLDVSDDHALLAGSLTWSHRDPFDRMLAAQAMAETSTLVTRDPVFADLAGVRTLW